MIKCRIRSFQWDNWYVSNWRVACHIIFTLLGGFQAHKEIRKCSFLLRIFFVVIWFFGITAVFFPLRRKKFSRRTFDFSCSSNLNFSTIMQFSCAIISNEKNFTDIFQKNILPSKNIFRNTKEHSTNWHNCIWNVQNHGAENNYTFELRKPSWNTKNALLDVHFQDPNFSPHRICWSEFFQCKSIKQKGSNLKTKLESTSSRKQRSRIEKSKTTSTMLTA